MKNEWVKKIFFSKLSFLTTIYLILASMIFLGSFATSLYAQYNWSGTTNKGKPMSFIVSADGSQWSTFKLKTSFSSGSTSGTIETTRSGPGAITNGQFSSSGSTFSFTGQFNSQTTASGTYTFSSFPVTIGLPYPPWVGKIYISQTGTWTATGQFPSLAPTVTTGSATLVSSGSATLNGTVNPNGKSTTCYFQYGTTASYGSTTVSASVGSGSSDVSVSSSVTGLSSNTTYHYRLVGTNSDGTSYGGDATFNTTSAPQISLNRNQLNFGSTTNGYVTNSQQLLVDNTGSGTLNWSATTNQSWLNCSPSFGTGSGTIAVSVNPSGLSVGTYSGTITVSDANATNSPQTVGVILTVYIAGSTTSPFGEFATPVNGSTVRSSIAVTGWALDDIEVVSVKIYNGSNYVGDAMFVEGARPDVEQSYPGYPMNYRAGWGYMMLTNFLPNGGNGTYIIYAKATDAEGHVVTLGSKTIAIDNANAVKPFGAIDTPTQGGIASGSSFTNWGWVLTPQPNSIPTDGSTINVFVDGVNIGNPNYNNYRGDIATLFPGYANSYGAAGYFSLDTTAYNNGVHTIFWIATDSGGNADGIGSRYFAIQNSGSSRSGSKIADNNQWKPTIKIEEFSNLPFNYFEPIKIKKGYGRNIQPQIIYPDDKSTAIIKIRELERIVIHISNVETGCLIAGNKIHPLPIGSTLDTKNGTFNWIPGPGFYGSYMLVFVAKDQNGELSKQEIPVNIVPKFGLKK